MSLCVCVGGGGGGGGMCVYIGLYICTRCEVVLLILHEVKLDVTYIALHSANSSRAYCCSPMEKAFLPKLPSHRNIWCETRCCIRQRAHTLSAVHIALLACDVCIAI